MLPANARAGFENFDSFDSFDFRFLLAVFAAKAPPATAATPAAAAETFAFEEIPPLESFSTCAESLSLPISFSLFSMSFATFSGVPGKSHVKRPRLE